MPTEPRHPNPMRDSSLWGIASTPETETLMTPGIIISRQLADRRQEMRAYTTTTHDRTHTIEMFTQAIHHQVMRATTNPDQATLQNNQHAYPTITKPHQLHHLTNYRMKIPDTGVINSLRLSQITIMILVIKTSIIVEVQNLRRSPAMHPLPPNQQEFPITNHGLRMMKLSQSVPSICVLTAPRN